MASTSTLCIVAKVLAVEKYIARLLDGVTPGKKGTKITKSKLAQIRT